jgi:hypothetical protein
MGSHARFNRKNCGLSWRRGYYLLHIWRQNRVRAFKDFNRSLKLVRTDFRYSGPILLRICESDEKARTIKLHLSRADIVPS